jgi:uncharacterized protein (DUF697 family)
MQLPVDIGGLLKIATNLKDAATTSIHVSVYIDDTASADVVAHVRSAVAAAGANTRVSITYLRQLSGGEGGATSAQASARVASDTFHTLPYVDSSDDFAIIVAGVNDGVGAGAAALRAAGVPVMVVTNMPGIVAGLAEVSGFEIPAGDIIAPVKLPRCPVPGLADAAGKAAKRVPVMSRVVRKDKLEHADEALLPLSEASARVLNERMGRWIADACSQNSVALALAFPFVRRPMALECKDATSAQNAAVGVVPFLGGADLPIMVLNQCKMVLQIATAYGHAVDKDRIKEIAVVILSGYAFRGLARTAVRNVPALGSVVGGTFGFVGTQVIGVAAIEYFEGGGDLVGLANVLQQAIKGATSKAGDFADTPLGQKAASKIKAAVTGTK